MAAIVTVLHNKNRRNISAAPGTHLLDALRAAGVYIPAVCGGRGSCGKCSLKVVSGVLPVTSADRAFFSDADLEGGWRLACAAFPGGNIEVEIPESGENRFAALSVFSEAAAAGKDRIAVKRAAAGAPLYGIAVDIGTTTLGFALVDLDSGEIAGRYSAVNRQREYGGDVISRIQRANSGDLPLLSGCVRRQIAEGIAVLCGEAGAALQDIQKIAVAGNTVMLHLLLGLSCQTLGKAPFTPVTLELATISSGLFEDEAPAGLSCKVTILPGISAYVGADIVSGIFFTELYKNKKAAAFVDIGTNGEMALACNGKILCAATAAGPAFEGGNIRWGTGSVPGAISRVVFARPHFSGETIGGGQPTGICGTGVIDTVSEGLKHGYILPSGRFSGKVPPQGIVLAKAADGRDIVFCQKDVREMQLAKSAIRSGLDALFEHAGLSYDDIQTLYIAGGFGFSLNLESAAGTGLVPRALLSKVSLAGNSALGGAVKLLLNPDSENALREIVKCSAEFNLSEDRYFKEHFIENIGFENTGLP